MGEIGVGIIGTGFMGECHALAFTAVAPLFQPGLRPRLEVVADVNAPAAERARDRFGFARATADWRELVADPRVELVSITSPNILHKEMALAAIAAGKHVYCEKPLALTAADARELTLAAEAQGVRTLVGYNYLCSPAIRHIKKLLDDGELGTAHLPALRCFEEDYMADPAVPFSWRCERARAGSGALGDMGSHAISLARFLGGADRRGAGRHRHGGARARGGAARRRPAVRPGRAADARCAGSRTRTSRTACSASRAACSAAWSPAAPPGAARTVRTSSSTARWAACASGRSGSTSSSCSAPVARKDDNGFRTVFCGPYHGDYGRFTPAPGHGIGFNDLKVIEVAGLLEGIATGGPTYPDFREGWAIEAVCDAILESAERRAWVSVPAPAERQREFRGGSELYAPALMAMRARICAGQTVPGKFSFD